MILYIFLSFVLAAFIKQELNSKQLHSILERIDSEDRDFSSLLEQVGNTRTDVGNMKLFNENSEKVLQDVKEKLTFLQNDSKAKTSQLSDIVNKTRKASDELRLLSDVNEKLERLNNDSKIKTLQINHMEKTMNQTSDELINLHLNMTSSNSHTV